MSKDGKFDLEERLIAYAVRILRVANALPRTSTGNHIRGQLTRSGTSAAPNYGEAQSAESRADFVHKIKVVLKELRESRVWLLIIQRAGLIKPAVQLNDIIQETNELIAIFVKSAKTAARNQA
jgi:four helix bundle protein